MKIRWLGHSCFLITTGGGTRILTDPFNEKVGYPLPSVEADVVTVSHEHGDHNNTSIVRGDFTLINAPGQYRVGDVDVLGVATFHDKSFGSARGKNTLFKISADGLSLAHCGDLGHLLDAQQAAQLGHVDVLLIPVGGYYTIDSQEAAMITRQLQPAVTIPMHYKVPGVEFPISTVDPFLREMEDGRQWNGAEIEITPEILPEIGGVLVLGL